MSKTPSEDDKPPERTNSALTKTPETVPTSVSPEGSAGRKKPAGAVSLFGGIDVFADKQSKSPLDKATDDDDNLLSKSSPPQMVKKEEKAKKSAVSLFDDDGDDEEDELDWSGPAIAPSKAADKNAAKVRACVHKCVSEHLAAAAPSRVCACALLLTQQPGEEKQHARSTGVFQDEELLFSQAQQKDNDPDVDLFSTAGKAAVSTASLKISAFIDFLPPHFKHEPTLFNS